jgi:hypothetical protein
VVDIAVPAPHNGTLYQSHHYTLIKKIVIIGFVVALVVASALLWQHSKHSSDVKLGRQITGAWKHGELFSQTLSLDGSFSSSIGHSNAFVTYQGTWLVKDQALVLTITNAHGTGSHRAGSPVGSVAAARLSMWMITSSSLRQAET